MEENIYREKSIERISSPDQLQDYMRVTSPGVWIVLIAIIVLLAGFVVCSALGTLETTVSVKAEVKNSVLQATLPSDTTETVKKGMKIKIEDKETTVEDIASDNSGTTSVSASIDIPDGTYDAKIVTEVVSPISFLISNDTYTEDSSDTAENSGNTTDSNNVSEDSGNTADNSGNTEDSGS